MSGKTCLDDPKALLLNYACSQALRDPRLASIDMVFQNFSLIVTIGRSNAQVEHIDLLAPGYQFGLMVSDESPGTSFLSENEPAEELSQYLPVVGGERDSVWKILMHNPTTHQLIKEFGAVLKVTQEKLVEVPRLARGSLCSLPGGVKHAGPESRKSRAVLFFSGHAEGDGSNYNPDVQYSASSLWQHLLTEIWGQATEDERCYLLGCLGAYMDIEKKYNQSPWAHFPEELVDFGKKLASLGGYNRRKHIRELARKARIGLFPPFPSPPSHSTLAHEIACVEESTACVGTTARILLERGRLQMWLLRRLWGLNKILRTFLGNLCFRRLCELSPTIRFDQARVVKQEEIRAFFRSVKDLEDGW